MPNANPLIMSSYQGRGQEHCSFVNPKIWTCPDIATFLEAKQTTGNNQRTTKRHVFMLYNFSSKCKKDYSRIVQGQVLNFAELLLNFHSKAKAMCTLLLELFLQPLHKVSCKDKRYTG